MIGVAGSVANNTSYWQAVRQGQIISYGRHSDLLVKRGSSWLIKKRVITHAWRLPPPTAAAAPTATDMQQ